MRNRLLFILILTGSMISCSTKDSQPIETDIELIDENITITREQAEKIGLEFSKLQYLTVSDVVTANGYLETPPQYKAMISSNIPGKIVRIIPIIGDNVKKGMELIRIESAEFLDMQKNYIVIKSTLKFLEDDYIRQKKLSEQNVNAKKVFLQSERDYRSAKAEYEIMRKKFEILQVNIEAMEDGKISSYLSIRSPLNGFVNRMNAVIGEVIETDDVLIEILNPEHLHAELNVYERDVLKIRKGQEVVIKVPQIEELEVKGEVFLIDQELDEESRTASVHVHIPENENLLAGMYIEGNILLSDKKVVAIPEGGLVREESGSFVYFLNSKTDNGYTFERAAVVVDVERKGMVAIRFIEEVDTSRTLAVGGVFYLSSGTY